MAAPSGKDAATGNKAFPSLTVPQILAVVAFLSLCVLAAIPNKTVSTAEFDEAKRLGIFLIGALLPSDALIRFGRNLFMRSAQDDTATPNPDPADFKSTTLAQILAFCVFIAVLVLTLVSNSIVDEKEVGDLSEVAAFLIAALLPSEAAIRFGRALYLRGATNVTPQQLKLI
jgi:hypothetical protein